MNKGYGAFCSFIRGKTATLIGAGVSNVPLVPFLLSCGAKSVSVRDLKKKENDQEVQSVLESGGKIILGSEYLSNLCEDVVIRSPGIRPDLPEFLDAQKKGSLITCETELFLRFVPCRSFGITGSDGKTTTTTLTAKILEEEGFKVFLGGNIGKSMLPQLEKINGERCVSVSELSSFQLMNCAYSPDVAIVTNLSENHLDWHRDMDEYLDAKTNILKHQNSSSTAILNFDNLHTRSCGTVGKRVDFSIQTKPDGNNSVFCKDGMIYHSSGDSVIPVLSVDDILLPGKHNVENYMAAIGATFPYVSIQSIQKIAKTFGGVEHRIELVRELDGIRFYNSSIDSSPTRSMAALRSFEEKLIMIAGGYDKNLDYSLLGDEICKRVKCLILCGDTTKKIKAAVESSPLYDRDKLKIIMCNEFDETVINAYRVAHSGDKVILSPASASFDLFRNFEERGKRFKALVMEL